jgi:alanine racemase
MRPVQARIDLGALRHNLAIARRRAGGARVWAVAKANAYGHGIERAQRAFEDADGIALLEIEAAIALRHRGWQKPVLMLGGFFEEDELGLFAQHGFTSVVHDAEQIAMLERARLARPLDVYLKLNSGMNRLGFDEGEFHSALLRLQHCTSVGAIAFMTHFADAEGSRGVAWQLDRFRATTAGLAAPRSLANSAALLRYPEAHADWVRPGIMLYGCSPIASCAAAGLGLRPAMTLASELVAVRELRAGDGVGYGCTFTASESMRAGIVACGYADGYPRSAPTGTPILVAGQRTRTLGRVAMDMISVDLREIPGAEVGSRVTLWGEGLSADEVAAAAGTVSYELLCALGTRVPKVEEDRA